MANPSFSTNVQPLFTQYCALSGCHAQTPGPGNLNLAAGNSYIQLINITAVQPVTCISGAVTTIASVRVNAALADPYKSVLMHRLEATCNVLPQMPSGNPPLEMGQIDIIRNWISSGAPNN